MNTLMNEPPMTREEEEEIQAMYPDHVFDEDMDREPDYESLSEAHLDAITEMDAMEDRYENSRF